MLWGIPYAGDANTVLRSPSSLERVVTVAATTFVAWGLPSRVEIRKYCAYKILASKMRRSLPLRPSRYTNIRPILAM